MAEGAEILLAEDDAALREGLALLLEGEGYVVRAAADGEQALELFRARRPDLVLLDVMMPKRNGYGVCAAIRAQDATVPILFLTAKDGEGDELCGLSVGADDYVSKTAPRALLLARLAAAARRARAVPPGAREDAARFRVGDWEVDAVGCRLVARSGRQVDLSLREVEVLRHFAAHPNETVARDFLIAKFWGLDYDGDENALSVFLHRLRGKLGPSGERIQTLHRRGYRLNA